MNMPMPEDNGPLMPEAAPLPTPRKGIAWLAWLAIVGLVLLLVIRPGSSIEPTAEEGGADGETMTLRLAKVQARFFIGAKQLEPQNPEFYESAKILDQGPPRQRQVFVTVAGELVGPAKALEQLDKLRKLLDAHPKEVTPVDRQVSALLTTLYQRQAGHEAMPLSEQERHYLTEKLGWFGNLALTPVTQPPDDPTDQAAWHAAREQMLQPTMQLLTALVGSITVVVGAALLGLIGLVVLLVLTLQGLLRNRLQTGSAHGGVYAETFAWWLVVFLGLSWLASLVPDDSTRLLRQGLAMLASLVVLAWPWLRGIPWGQIRQDIGWTAGQNWLLELILGAPTYVVTLPLAVVGVVITLMLVMVQTQLAQMGGEGIAPLSGSGMPIQPHPIVQYLIEGDVAVLLQVFFLASVVAPIVEETMFRGVLYRHLREVTSSAGLFVSVVASAMLVSFVFAVIHPVPFVAVPPLLALALGFTLAREWRGTILPCVIAHGMSNALVATLAILLFRG